MAFACAIVASALAPPRPAILETPASSLVLADRSAPYHVGMVFPYVRTVADPRHLDPQRLGPYLDGATYAEQDSASALHADTVVFRLRLRELPTETPVGWVIHGAKAIGAMALYLPLGDGTYRTIESGMNVPYTDRPFPAIDPVIALPRMVLDDRPIYLAVSLVNETRLPEIARAADVLNSEREGLSLASLFGGFFLALALSSLLIFMSVRSRASLHYAALMAGGLALVLVIEGWPWEFLWPSLSVDWRAAGFLALFLAFGTTVNFTRVFLSLPRHFPRVDRVLRLTFWLAMGACALYALAPNLIVTSSLMVLATNGLFFAMLAAAMISVERGLTSARYSVLAFAGICASSSLGAAVMAGSLAVPLSSAEWIIAVGIAWQALMLSLGLAQHLSRLDRERVILTKENRSLESLATHDPVTGIPNRRAFDERLILEWRRALRNGRELAVLMIDIDHFKAYNDTFGHVAGDACLRAIARALEGCMLRSGDFVGRYGGEEFAAIVPDVPLGEASALAELMRQRTRDLGIRGSDGTSHVTVSVGIAVGVGSAVTDPVQLVRLADEALYAAKSAGRDRTVARPVVTA